MPNLLLVNQLFIVQELAPVEALFVAGTMSDAQELAAISDMTDAEYNAWEDLGCPPAVAFRAMVAGGLITCRS